MKKVISLIAVVAIMCTMLVPSMAVFADDAVSTTVSAYDWMDITGLTNSTSPNYISAGTGVKDESSVWVAKNVRANGCLYIADMDFGTTVPTSVVTNIYVDQSSTDHTLRFYAFPVGTTINTVASGKPTSFTLPGAEEPSTDPSAYLIMEQSRKGGQYSPAYELEYGATGLVPYQFKLDSAAVAKLINPEQTSNRWCIVMTASDSGSWNMDGFKFVNDGKLDAFSFQPAGYNYSSYLNIDSISNGLFSANSATRDVEYNIVFKDVDFGSKSDRNLAVMLSYGKYRTESGSGLYLGGDIAVDIDVNDDGIFDDATERLAQVTTVQTAMGSSGTPTNHYALLSSNVTGVHDVKIRFLDRYIARFFAFQFKEVDLADVYADVTVDADETDPTKSNITLPINKSYIKGDSKYLVAIYDVAANGSKVLDKLQSIDVSVNTVADHVNGKGNTCGDTYGRHDYGFDNTLATIQFNTADIAGKEIKVFLWKNMTDLVPLVPSSVASN